MPFTPFHMGPGAAIKAVTGRHFSLMVFGFSQIAIDIEPLIRLLRGEAAVHGFTHNYMAALIIGLFSMGVGKVFCEGLLRLWNAFFQFRYLRWLTLNPTISWWSAALGAYIGTFSHVLLDSLIHSDMQPFAPFSRANGLLNLLPTGWVYLLCVFLGLIGFMTIFLIGVWNRWSIEI